MTSIHKRFLLKAHSLAGKNFGKTFPNPSVGCIIVKNNKIISKGATAKAGRPHAEEIALKKAKKNSFGSTMYVTLEPCNHDSYNGSCTNQIIRSGIKSIFIANSDPDPRTNKKSIKKLQKNNIKTNVGLTHKKTYELNKFFFKSLKNKKPFTKVKMAISKDEKIAWEDYKSKWISNIRSRNFAHILRNKSQAILTSSKTIIKDNPRFTVRKNNKIIKFLPLIIIDNLLKIPLKSYVLNTLSKRRVIIFTSQNNKKSQYLKKIGCEIFFIKKKNNLKLNFNDIFKKIYLIGIRDILVEAGGIFLTELLKNKLVDELHLFKSPKKIGKKGIPFLIGKSMKDLKMTIISKKKFGNDKYLNYLIKS
mgnify:CR=1 FL=1